MDINIDATPWQYYRVRKIARKMIQGAIVEQYAKLCEYCAKLKRMNLGSTVKIKSNRDNGVDDNTCFQRIYICFDGLKKGWINGCRRIIGLDSCFLKGLHKGQLLTTIRVDPNNQYYPVAYAVVKAETRESWLWFLVFLQDNLQIYNSHGIAWIIDKQKGLLDAIVELFPHSEHSNCVKHLHNNFKVENNGLQPKQILWGAAKSTTETRFKQNMERMWVDSAAAYEWLQDKSPTHWNKAYFKSFPKCDMLCNNMCEAFNYAIIKARDKPIITLLEMIRNYLMNRLTRKRQEIHKWTHPVGPKVFKYMEKVKLETTVCKPSYSYDRVFLVECFDNEQFVVDLGKRTCACRRWKLISMPCVHAMSVIMTENPFDFVDACYKKEIALQAYTLVIYALNGHSMWPKIDQRPLQLPAFRKQRDRPKKARTLQSDEVRKDGKTKIRKNYTVIQCRNCSEQGHNIRSCNKPQATTSSAQD